MEEADPAVRLRRALRELYAYYDRNRQMIANSLRDIEVMPPFVGELVGAHLAEVQRVLLEGWPPSLQPRMRPAVAHAVDFRAWHSLADAGLGAREAADLMADMVGCLAG